MLSARAFREGRMEIRTSGTGASASGAGVPLASPGQRKYSSSPFVHPSLTATTKVVPGVLVRAASL